MRIMVDKVALGQDFLQVSCYPVLVISHRPLNCATAQIKQRIIAFSLFKSGISSLNLYLADYSLGFGKGR
jgi:hypothetical protein